MPLNVPDWRELARLGYDTPAILRLVAADMKTRHSRLLSLAAGALPAAPTAPTRTRAAKPATQSAPPRPAKPFAPAKPAKPATATKPKAAPGHGMSAEGRARIAAAQRKRWAEHNKAKAASSAA